MQQHESSLGEKNLIEKWSVSGYGLLLNERFHGDMAHTCEIPGHLQGSVNEQLPFGQADCAEPGGKIPNHAVQSTVRRTGGTLGHKKNVEEVKHDEADTCITATTIFQFPFCRIHLISPEYLPRTLNSHSKRSFSPTTLFQFPSAEFR